MEELEDKVEKISQKEDIRDKNETIMVPVQDTQHQNNEEKMHIHILKESNCIILENKQKKNPEIGTLKFLRNSWNVKNRYNCKHTQTDTQI